MIYLLLIIFGFILGYVSEGMFSGHIYGTAKNELHVPGNRNYNILGDKSVDPHHFQGVRARIVSLGLTIVIILITLAPGSPMSEMIYSGEYNIYAFIISLIVSIGYGNYVARLRVKKMIVKYNIVTHEVRE